MTHFLPADSPLLNPPSSLTPKQRVALDGIRLAFDMLAMAWTRLVDELTDISIDRETGASRSRLTTTYMNAWIVVDVLHRLRLLVNALPGLKRPPPEVEAAIRGLVEVRSVRDGLQHVDRELQNAATHQRPLWGTISWVRSSPNPGQALTRIYTLILGGIRDGEWPFPNPLGKTIDVPVGMITVDAFGQSLDLSLQVSRARSIARYLDAAARAVPNSDGGLADILMSVDVA
jgi:hypothetical protein